MREPRRVINIVKIPVRIALYRSKMFIICRKYYKFALGILYIIYNIDKNKQTVFMKRKLSLLSIAMLVGYSVSAQQLPNSNFDGVWVNCYPWEKGAKVKNARGTQPDGWCMANVNGMGGLGATVVGAQGEDRSGEEGKKSVTITNTPTQLSAKQVVPGYISLGTTWATAKASMSGVVTEETADGGVFGGIALAKRPDALSFYYKRAHDINKATKSPVNLTEKASIIAYSWKGTWTQVEVPSNTHPSNLTKVTMTDRSNNILGKDCLTGGAITKTDNAELISQIEYYIEGDQADWKLITIPFEYKNETAIPEKFNVIFAANDIFADRAGIGAGNQLCIDDVELVYYHSLTALSYDGKAIEGFAEDKYEYSLKEVYDASKDLTYTKTGIASTVSTSYDEETALLSICVKGDDGEETVYTIQFDKLVDSKTYQEKLYVDGSTEEPQIANVVVETLCNGNINFTLKNFVLGGVTPLGNISLKDIEVAADKTFTFKGGINIEAGDDGNYSQDEWLGPMLAMTGEIPLNLSGKFADDKVLVTFDIDMSETLGENINVHLGYDRMKANMTITNAKYATFCAPMDVELAEGVKAYSCPQVENNALVLEQVTGNILPANTPVILWSETPCNKDCEGYAESVDENPTCGRLIGVYTTTAAPEGSYVLQKQKEKVAFFKVTASDIKVGACRAYLSVPSSNVKSFSFDTEMTTSIQVLNSLMNDKAEIYDLNGHKLNSLQKGINIVNDVKVIVK